MIVDFIITIIDCISLISLFSLIDDFGSEIMHFQCKLVDVEGRYEIYFIYFKTWNKCECGKITCYVIIYI